MRFRAGFNTYSTHLCISDKYTHLRKHTSYLSRQTSQTPQTVTNPFSPSSTPTWISPEELAATAAEGGEGGENEVRVLFLIPTHSRRKLIINFLYSATPTGRHPAHVRADEELS